MPKSWIFPESVPLEFESIRLEPFDAETHSKQLFEISKPGHNEGEDIFEFMLNTGPFPELELFRNYIQTMLRDQSRLPYAVYSNRLKQLLVQHL